jgi:hypothetical protein
MQNKKVMGYYSIFAAVWVLIQIKGINNNKGQG